MKINVTDLIKPDYSNLASEYEAISSYLTTQDNKVVFEFEEKGADYVLSQVLAKKHFGINLELDQEYLCPRIPNRYLYVEFIQTLIADGKSILNELSSSSERTSKEEEKEVITILDVGVGSSCIYPLLFTSLQPTWKCIGTDINAESLALASHQLDLNPSLKPRINLLTPKNPSRYFDALTFDACVCNPPFYESCQQFQESRDSKKVLTPSAKVFQAKNHEMVTEGGEYSFVLGMIKESVQQQEKHINERVLWYTSMLGHKDSVVKLIQDLKVFQVPSFVVHEIVTHKNSTKRWILGWSFKNIHFSSNSALSPKVSFEIQTGKTMKEIDTLLMRLLDFENNIKCNWRLLENDETGLLKVDKDIWSRAYRRRAKNKRIKTDVCDEKKCISIFKFTLKNKVLLIDWKHGKDAKLFESLITLFQKNL